MLREIELTAIEQGRFMSYFVWGTRSLMLDSVFDAGLSFGRRGLVYICLGYWVVYTDILGGFSRLSRTPFTHHVISSCNLLVNITRVLSQPSSSFCL